MRSSRSTIRLQCQGSEVTLCSYVHTLSPSDGDLALARSFGGLAAPNFCDFVLINSFSEEQIESRLFEKQTKLHSKAHLQIHGRRRR